MHTCIHAYMHTCIHAYMHTCIHAYMHTCIHTYMHACMHTYTCMYMYIHIYIYIHCIYIYIHVYIYVCVYIYIYRHSELPLRRDADEESAHVLFGQHYLTNATCLMRPHSSCACFVVSRISVICQIVCHLDRQCLRYKQ